MEQAVALFEQLVDPEKNLLPRDGVVNYHSSLFSPSRATELLNRLFTDIQWAHDQVTLFGKTHRTKRKVAWYADGPITYRYSGNSKIALTWTDILLHIRAKVEEASHTSYNACLLNLYHSGEEGMSWHSDAEKELKENGSIASLSLGAKRKFSFKHRNSAEKVDLYLEHGSLLVMKGATQTHWLHQLPATKKVAEPRINLTFRQMNES